MKKTTLEYETNHKKEYQEIPDDIFEKPLKLEEKEDDKPQLVIGILLIIFMVFAILAVFIPALVPLFSWMPTLVIVLMLVSRLSDG